MIENDCSSMFMVDNRSPEAMIMEWLIFQQDRHKTTINSHSFHSMSIDPLGPHTEATALSKFDLENSRSRSCKRSKFLASKCVPLFFHVNLPCYSYYTSFSTFDLENPRSRSWAHDVAQLQFRQFHSTSNGVNQSGGFRDMCSTKSGPQHKFWAHGQAHVGQMGK